MQLDDTPPPRKLALLLGAGRVTRAAFIGCLRPWLQFRPLWLQHFPGIHPVCNQTDKTSCC